MKIPNNIKTFLLRNNKNNQSLPFEVKAILAVSLAFFCISTFAALYFYLTTTYIDLELIKCSFYTIWTFIIVNFVANAFVQHREENADSKPESHATTE